MVRLKGEEDNGEGEEDNESRGTSRKVYVKLKEAEFGKWLMCLTLMTLTPDEFLAFTIKELSDLESTDLQMY